MVVELLPGRDMRFVALLYPEQITDFEQSLQTEFSACDVKCRVVDDRVSSCCSAVGLRLGRDRTREDVVAVFILFSQEGFVEIADLLEDGIEVVAEELFVPCDLIILPEGIEQPGFLARYILIGIIPVAEDVYKRQV